MIFPGVLTVFQLQICVLPCHWLAFISPIKLRVNCLYMRVILKIDFIFTTRTNIPVFGIRSENLTAKPMFFFLSIDIFLG